MNETNLVSSMGWKSFYHILFLLAAFTELMNVFVADETNPHIQTMVVLTMIILAVSDYIIKEIKKK